MNTPIRPNVDHPLPRKRTPRNQVKLVFRPPEKASVLSITTLIDGVVARLIAINIASELFSRINRCRGRLDQARLRCPTKCNLNSSLYPGTGY